MKSKYIVPVFLNLLVIIPLLYLCFFTYPSADDYSYGVSLMKNNFIDTNIDRYLSWTSRYFATSVLITAPIAFGEINYYWIYPLVSILFFLIIFFLIFNELGVDKPKSILISFSILSIYSLIITSLSENYFWLAGNATYFFPSIIFTFYCLILFKNDNQNNIKYYIYSLVCLIIIGGSVEILLGFALIVTTLLLFWIFYKKKKFNRLYLVNLFIIILLILFVLISPGNQERSLIITNVPNLDILEIASMSLRKTIVINIRYVFLFFLFTLPLISFFKVRFPFKKNNLLIIILLFLTMNLFLFLGSFVSIYGLKMFFPPRVENLLIFITMLFIIIISIYVNTAFNINYKIYSLLFFSGVVLYFILPKNEFQKKNNLELMYNDIFSGSVLRYKNEFLIRDEILKKCNGDCYINYFTKPPRSILFKDINSDKNHYINKAMSNYYKVNSIEPK